MDVWCSTDLRGEKLAARVRIMKVRKKGMVEMEAIGGRRVKETRKMKTKTMPMTKKRKKRKTRRKRRTVRVVVATTTMEQRP